METKKTHESRMYMPEKKCHKCGKIFIPGVEHIYKERGKYYCCWTCFLHRKDPEVKLK